MDSSLVTLEGINTVSLFLKNELTLFITWGQFVKVS